MTRYGMVIDTARCVGCQTCVVACQAEHALMPGIAWNWVDRIEWGRWPQGASINFAHACLHCDDPLCVSACPTGASLKRDDGIVLIDYELCIGCGVCMTACPYGARSISEQSGWFFGAASPAPYEDPSNARDGVAQKCTLCADRVDAQRGPVCVEQCVTGARVFGDLDDPRSEVSRFIAEHKCSSIAGTAAFYANMNDSFDMDSFFARDAYTPASVKTENETATPNPPALIASGVLVAAAAGGIGIATVNARKKRADK